MIGIVDGAVVVVIIDGAIVTTGMFEGASLVLMTVGTDVGTPEGISDGDSEVANADGRIVGIADGITEGVGRDEGIMDEMKVGSGLVGTAVKAAVATDVGTDVVVAVVGERDGMTDGDTLVCADNDGTAVGNRVGMIASTTLIPTILSSEMFKT